MIYRYYTEKRDGYDTAAKAVEAQLRSFLKIPNASVRLLTRYDVQGVQGVPEERLADITAVISNPLVDNISADKLPVLPHDSRLLITESLPGQYDILADTTEQCIQFVLSDSELPRPIVKTAKVYVISDVNDSEFAKIKAYLINPVEEREAQAQKPETLLDTDTAEPDDVALVSQEDLTHPDKLGLAMSAEDLATVREYFTRKGRQPTITEIRMLDTYWSDHCRHTTFNTQFPEAEITINDARVKAAFEAFKAVNGDRPVTLMNIATAAMRHMRKSGELPMLYETESDENNACTIKIADKAGDTLLFFKNETHNHPTEIEPFGGAATCVGGAIRDPLSGRAYVYQAMRITGAGDPRTPFEDTVAGKLPQRKITTTAAAGYSSYGNQIGVAAGYVRELYHPGYVAKRMELGAVIASAKEAHVRREKPLPGDVVIVMGARTGRDGVGGATGSSKEHEKDTVTKSAAEVQKGDAPKERNLQRLLSNPDVTRLIKKCNDFGAGGASVAIGEIADGVEIDLDTLPTKYAGLDGTELAISESQERMAVVVAASDAQELLRQCLLENVEAVIAAKITQTPRLVMKHRGKTIVDIARAFLDSAGATRYTKVLVGEKGAAANSAKSQTSGGSLLELNTASQKGLAQMFDCSVGAGTIFAPYGGKYQLTENPVMAALIPALPTKASLLAYGYEPYLSEADPFAGAQDAVVASVAKLVAAGADLDSIHLSLQEYFPRLGDCPERWGVVFSAMLGAFSAQMGLKIAAIGGKDSMSGSFGTIDVPPTLVSFACGVGAPATLISNEFRRTNSPVYALKLPQEFGKMREMFEKYGELVRTGAVLSARYCRTGRSFSNMCLGNMIGYEGESYISNSIVFEAAEELPGYVFVGRTQAKAEINGTPLSQIREKYEAPLEGIFPVNPAFVKQSGDAPTIADTQRPGTRCVHRSLLPKAIIPVFPGTIGEFDAQQALEREGGKGEQVLIRNLTPALLQESVAALEAALKAAQMLIIPACSAEYAGYSAALLKNPRLANAVAQLLERGGLVLKIGAITTAGTLAPNTIGRHQSCYARVRVSSTASPWLSKCEAGEVYLQAVSHSAGRFVAEPHTLEALKERGQIALQFADFDGNASMDIAHNPFGSDYAAAGISSECGRVLEVLIHPERYNEHTVRNIRANGDKYLPVFKSGVKYFM